MFFAVVCNQWGVLIRVYGVLMCGLCGQDTRTVRESGEEVEPVLANKNAAREMSE